MSGEMSGAGERGMRVKNESRKCAERLWRIFPHLTLCGSLVAYAALGALIFQLIEGGNPPSDDEYRAFLEKVVCRVQNDTNNSSCTRDCVLEGVKDEMETFKPKWHQDPRRWNFFNSMFFCCTVFTTVGYGEIYPVTLLGKVVCVLYAMVGIPLMFLVILDVGDFLAVGLSRAYIQIHKLFKDLCSHTWSPSQSTVKAADCSHQALEDGTFVFSHDVVIREPLDIRQVIRSQADVRHKSMQLENNREIFEKLLARENLLRKAPLLRTLSCPELDRLPRPPKGYAIWDFTGLGNEMETLNIPFVLILFIVFAYICFGGLILPLWETNFRGFDSYYFCFITLTTIGFGDIMPQHPKFFLLISLFIIVGMAIMSMAFKLSQTRIVSCYHKFIKFISRGNVKTFKETNYPNPNVPPTFNQ